jgi:hypothetical protein
MNVAAILDREASYAYDKNGNVTGSEPPPSTPMISTIV